MKINFVQDDHSKHAAEKLAQYYKDELIPAEKKPYLSMHRKSFGPYLAVEGTNEVAYIQDAASQIATLGLGFNPTPFFGVPHFKEAWTNDQTTQDAKDLIKSFHGFLKKKTENRNIDICFVNSGAEANETAMGMAYLRRKNPEAKKVLAFEGSFHGRFMVSLFSTWNKTKREPFQLKGYETTFAPYPALEHSDFMVELEDGWRELWQSPRSTDFEVKANKFRGISNELDAELDSLLFVREQLNSGEFFVVIAEPMQCEGGDRYSTNRFNTALLLLSKSFEVPLIFDEVQTGFGLGRDFFWHRSFNITDSHGNTVHPDFVTCAKKSQTGIVIGDGKLEWHNTETQFASILRGFYHGLIIDQKNDIVLETEGYVAQKLDKLLASYKQLSKPRCYGMAFAFEIDNAEDIPKFITNRFKAGLLFYQAGAQTLRFRLNTAYKKEDVDFLFDMISNLCDHIYLGKELRTPAPIEKPNSEIDYDYEWHTELISLRSNNKNKRSDTFAVDFFKKNFGLNLVFLNQDLYQKYRDQIIALEEEVYEPARQTSIENFDLLVSKEPNIAIALTDKDDKLIGISFAGKISLFPKDRGLRRCRHFNDPKSLYMLDTTICVAQQGAGLGKFLKYTLEMIGIEKGLNYIYGRNRDRLAGAMLGVNLSLGCIPEIYIEEDYPDDEDYRDVFIYRSPLSWGESSKTITDEVNSPLRGANISEVFVAENIDKMINKICLSNFVSESFLKNVQTVAHTAPNELRHIYTASGQGESVDKIAKSIIYNVADKKRQKFLTYRGHYFGKGSFLSRSLSCEESSYFPTLFLDNPTSDNYEEILQQTNQYLTAEDVVAIYIEPQPQGLNTIVPDEFLVGLKAIAQKTGTKLVYNETSYANLGHSKEQRWRSNNPEIMPDAFFAYLGGQAAMTFMKNEIFLEKPLMMISTWDGDALSMAQFVESMKQVSELEPGAKLKIESSDCVEAQGNSRFIKSRDLDYSERLTFIGNGPYYPTVGNFYE
jgi:acetylornithine/succinyldiaminopimelate/putrescine aminotransferase